MTRSQIRYALYRCKAGTHTDEHLKVFQLYKPQLDEFEFTASDFAVDWDVDKKNLANIVTGATVKKYIRELNAPILVPAKG
jgi:hypothetical protein